MAAGLDHGAVRQRSDAALRQLPWVDALMTGLRKCKQPLIHLDGGAAHRAGRVLCTVTVIPFCMSGVRAGSGICDHHA